MNDLQKTELFSLLTENSQKVSNDEMHHAYETFVHQVQHLNQSDNDYSVVFRTLNSTRIEFEALRTQNSYEQGEKCVENSILSESNPVYRI